jgi:L-amino acid N-acyltransferase YncA
MIHRRRHVMAIGARAAEERRRARGYVSCSELRERAVYGEFALMIGEIEDAASDNGMGRHVTKQRIDIGNANSLKHRHAIVGRQWKIAHRFT